MEPISEITIDITLVCDVKITWFSKDKYCSRIYTWN